MIESYLKKPYLKKRFYNKLIFAKGFQNDLKTHLYNVYNGFQKIFLTLQKDFVMIN